MDAANSPLVPLEPQPLDGPCADPATLTGQRLLDRYRIEMPIGQGGMAHVYAGRHLALDREVAIKVLRQRFAQRQSVVERFLLEARAASRVRHPHIVEVTDFGSTPDGLVFMVMERLEGETLGDTIEREGGLPWQRVRAIVLQLCDALQTTHDAGIVHRDISLKNFFRLSRGKNPDFVKVLDFGIASMKSDDEARGPGTVRRLTSDTQIMGTPEFMSPEQATRSGSVDARSDIYAMGVVLYAMLTGKLPFEAATAIDMMAKHIYEPVPPPSQHVPELPRAVEAVVMRALEKDPLRRFQSMAALGHALATIPEDARRTATESGTMLKVGFAANKPHKRWGPMRRFTMVGLAAGLAVWGWRDSGRLVEQVAAFDFGAARTLDSMALPSPVVAPAETVTEPVLEPLELHVTAPDSAMRAPMLEMRPASLPPEPPPGWLDRPTKRARPKAAPPSAAPAIAAAPAEPQPQNESPAIEPTAIESPPEPPAIVPEPEPETTFSPIDEVKDPFAQ